MVKGLRGSRSALPIVGVAVVALGLAAIVVLRPGVSAELHLAELAVIVLVTALLTVGWSWGALGGGRRGPTSLCRTTLETIGEGMIYVHVNSGTVVEGNSAARRLLGVDGPDFPHTPLSELVEAEPALLDALLDAVRAGRRIERMEVGLWGLSTDSHPIEISVTPLEYGGERLAVLLFRDIADRKRSQERARFFAYHDPLTGLPNRMLLQDRLNVSLAQAARTDECVGVMFLDVDRFKEINDTLGHDAGDELLKQVGLRLKATVRTGDTVARQGGDEFIVLLPRVQHDEETHTVAERLVAAMRQPFQVAGQEVRVSGSIGVSVFPTDGRDCETLVRHADLAMYQSKERGRGTYTIFDPGLDARVANMKEMRQRLRRAIDDHEFELHYQPQIEAATGQVVALEALIRWRTDDLGWIAPGRFLPVAEESGLIIPLGQWVLSSACHQLKGWLDEGVVVPRVCVNVSTKQLADRTFVDTVKRALASSRLEARYLEIEVTETLAMKDPDATLSVLAELKAMGLQVTLDDFGVGYSSLTYLRRFPFDRIKIHGELIEALADSHTERSLVQSIISLSKALGLQVVAECVETTEQLSHLCQMGCDLLQGYGLARPMPATYALDFIREATRTGGVSVSSAVMIN